MRSQQLHSLALWIIWLSCISSRVIAIRVTLGATRERSPAIWATTTRAPGVGQQHPKRSSFRARNIQAAAAERAALLAFKRTLSSSDAIKLASWVEGTEHCDGSWLGVQCLNKKPKRVYMLDLSDQGMTLTLSNINFSALSALQVLWLQGNVISDGMAVFAAPGGFSRLVELRMHDAALTGTLPSSLPARLKKLHLQNNQLSGTLPAELSASAPDLEVLLLESNNLQGSIPETWKFAKLKQLSLENNPSLVGCVPAWAQSVLTSAAQSASANAAGRTLSMGNTQLCGMCGSVACSASTAPAGPSPTDQLLVQLQPPAQSVPAAAAAAGAAAPSVAPSTSVAVPVATPAADAAAAAAAAAAALPAAPAAATTTPAAAPGTDPAAAAPAPAVAPAAAATTGAAAAAPVPPVATAATPPATAAGTAQVPPPMPITLMPPPAAAVAAAATPAAAVAAPAVPAPTVPASTAAPAIAVATTAVPAVTPTTAAAAAPAVAAPTTAVPTVTPTTAAATAAAPAIAAPTTAVPAVTPTTAAAAPAVPPANPIATSLQPQPAVVGTASTLPVSNQGTAITSAAAVPAAATAAAGSGTPAIAPAGSSSSSSSAGVGAPVVSPTGSSSSTAISAPVVVPPSSPSPLPVPVSTAAVGYPPGMGPIDPDLTVIPDQGRKPTYI